MVVHNARENDGRVLVQMLDALRQGAAGSSAVTVLVLAAADHDGVCAARILIQLLQRAEVKYTLHPVAGNAEVIEEFRRLEQDGEVRSLVLLNCGASLDLQQQLEECAAPVDLRCYVVDAHRPLLLANLSTSRQRVVVIDDDVAEASGLRPPVDDDDDDSDGASDVDGGATEDDGEEEAAGAGGAGRARRAARAAEQEDKKRRRALDRRKHMERKRRRMNEYYMSSYYATPAAMSLFKMAKQAAAPSSDLLWVAAVSLMGYYELGLISKVEYERLAWEELKEALDRTAEHHSSQSSAGGALGAEAGTHSDEENGSAPPSRRRPPRGAVARQRLRFEIDLRLTLYKHWTLEESMMHSSYTYGTMELHRDKGKRSLLNFFATGGIPPNDYKQLYSGMEAPIRKDLHQKFKDHGRGFGLTADKMFLSQFVRDLGPLGEAFPALLLHELSCSDAVHVVTSLLSVVPAALSEARMESLPKTADGRRDMVAVDDLERKGMVDNFWRAYDAVLCKDPTPLRDGICEAVAVVQAVQQLARTLKDTKSIQGTRLFRWCRIEHAPSVFRHPVAVRLLAVWLLQVFYAYQPAGEALERPLLVVVRDPVRDTYLCVGATPARLSEGHDEFGNRFRNVLRADRNLKYRYDFFDKSCIEVAADDFDRFWDILRESAF